MTQGKAEDAGGLTPAKDDNTALWHFGHRTLPIFKCVDYSIPEFSQKIRTVPVELAGTVLSVIMRRLSGGKLETI
jgi:hypothetical protein